MAYFFNSTRGKLLATNAKIADNFFSRSRGLLFKPQLTPGEGLLIKSCPSIHMFWMTYSIDAVFMDTEGKVVGLSKEIKPNQISPYFAKSRDCLELPAGTIDDTATEIGDQVISSELPLPGYNLNS